VLNKTEEWILSDGLKNNTTFIADFDLHLPDTLPPESEFTLSAFGLPEPPGVTWERPTPWWLYGIAVGLALVVLSGILFRVFGRLRRQGTKT
ncbi:MAG: hypothetical protein NZM31_12325, partial [Gemmatales bacterium]|nr:hypothetical protein [Gemmatales bacterium]MDW8387781.1 hypothetical protein [Gemmatales bacterium]